MYVVASIKEVVLETLLTYYGLFATLAADHVLIEVGIVRFTMHHLDELLELKNILVSDN